MAGSCRSKPLDEKERKKETKTNKKIQANAGK